MSYFVGTSGWAYADWKDTFYHTALRQEDWLAHYATQFNAVEVNSTFYHVPRREAVEHWRASTPSKFIFAVKLSRYITHVKKLHVDQETQRTLEYFFHSISALGKKLAVVLVQLPANLHKDYARLEAFIVRLKQAAKKEELAIKFAFEFRHASWFTEDIQSLLHHNTIANVIASGPPSLAVSRQVTTTFDYIRFHGAPRLYQSEYSTQQLQAWAADIKRAQVKETYIFFNNTMGLHAIKNAKQLKAMLGDA